MEIKQEPKRQKAAYNGVKPLQTIPYTEKTQKWKEENVEYLIQTANFKIGQQGTQEKIDRVKTWYDAYNNKIDQNVFDYVINPLNATQDLFKKFPAKIRPYNILRPTIDLLIGEYSKRPFKFDVINTDGDGVMNSFLDAKYNAFKGNVTDRLVREITQATGEEPQPGDIPDPATILDDFNTNYKDLKAIKGYKALKIIEFEQKLKEKFKDMFKDWLIAGDISSMKGVKHSDILYERLSPLWVDVDKSPLTKNYEDGESAVAKFRITVSDLVDLFYDELKETDIVALEKDESAYRRGLHSYFISGGNKGSETERLNKIDLYYTTWKSRKLIGILSYPDPLTGETQTMTVDEDYPVDKERGEEVEWVWVNDVYEGWRVNDDLYLGIRPLNIQRNEIYNLSECKLGINGRKFSDTESENVSVLSLGLPYQIMYIILNYRIELTIAKSRGKMLILDKNTLGSDDDEHGQEKTFYYAEALGYFLLDRSNDKVDRTWNQYSVQDMSLFDSIAQLIKLAQYYKDSWEELLGINRQRKGASNSSDGLGVTEEAIFRSSIISDIIFSSFDEFIESELQGLIDISKFAWIDGKKGYYKSDDGKLELFNIDPEDYTNASMGVFVDVMSQLQPKLEMMKQQINAIAQRKEVKLSTIADLIFTDSYAELKAKLKKAEAVELEINNRLADNAEAAKQEELKIKKEYEIFQNMLEIEKQERDWDRKDNNEYIKGEIQGRIAKDPSGMDIDMTAIEEASNKRLEMMEKTRTERMKIKSNEAIAVMKDQTEQKKIAASLKNKVSGEK